MVLNATEWVENHIGVDIQKEIVITYKFAAFKGADQLFRISSVGRMCQIEYETAGRNSKGEWCRGADTRSFWMRGIPESAGGCGMSL